MSFPMIGKDTPFSITFLFKGPDEKVLLFKRGETPAKDEDEADAVLSSCHEEECDNVEKVIAAIKLFSECEEGAEECITKELRELEDEYGFTLEAVGSSLDVDNEDKEDEELDIDPDKNDDDEEEEDETSPFDVMKEERIGSYTNPYDYDEMDDAPVESELPYSPILSEEEFLAEVEELEENVGEVLNNLPAKYALHILKTYYGKDSTIENKLFWKDKAFRVVNMELGVNDKPELDPEEFDRIFNSLVASNYITQLGPDKYKFNDFIG
jgi:hypothetical protein